MKNQGEKFARENLVKLVNLEDFRSEIGIKKDAYYRDAKFLGIKNLKDENGLLCISQKDAERLKALRNHIQETGKRQGFNDNGTIINENINDNTELTINENEGDDSAINEQENPLQNSESSPSARTLPTVVNRTQNSEENSALITSNSRDNSRLNTNNSKDSSFLTHEDEEDIYVEPEAPTANINVDGLIREAAELKAREIAMPELVKRAFADKMTEDDLPFDLQEKVNLAREAANPKYTPSMVAETLLARYRQQKAG